MAGKTKHKLPDISCSTLTAAEATALWKYFPLSFLIIAAVAFVLVCRSHEVLPSVKPSFLRNEDDPDKATPSYSRKASLGTLGKPRLLAPSSSKDLQEGTKRPYWALLTRERLFHTWFPRLEPSLRKVTDIKQKGISPT